MTNYELMSIAILFQVLPEQLENRVKKALQALREGNLTDLQAASFFFKYFFQRLDPMYRDNPAAASAIQEAVKNQIVGFVVPKYVDVTLHINTITDLKFTTRVAPKTPSLVFENIEVVQEILLAKITLIQVLVDNKIKIKKMAKILRWLAPIATIQTEAMLEKVRDEDLAIMDRNLKEIGF